MSIIKNIKLIKYGLLIIAALKEFAKNGYERASTNEIIKKADIS